MLDSLNGARKGLDHVSRGQAVKSQQDAWEDGALAPEVLSGAGPYPPPF